MVGVTEARSTKHLVAVWHRAINKISEKYSDRCSIRCWQEGTMMVVGRGRMFRSNADGTVLGWRREKEPANQDGQADGGRQEISKQRW